VCRRRDWYVWQKNISTRLWEISTVMWWTQAPANALPFSTERHLQQPCKHLLQLDSWRRALPLMATCQGAGQQVVAIANYRQMRFHVLKFSMLPSNFPLKFLVLAPNLALLDEIYSDENFLTRRRFSGSQSIPPPPRQHYLLWMLFMLLVSMTE